MALGAIEPSINPLLRKDGDDASVLLALIKDQVQGMWLVGCTLIHTLQLYSAWLGLKGERLKRAAVSLLESLATLALEVSCR